MAADKETIYVDIDDEITAIIDKVKAAKSRIIALVLPKRASVLQSVVNMKLLKKAADNAKKNVVLITSETALLPLAGAARLHVAKSLQSKPVLPPAPDSGDEDAQEVVEDNPADSDDSLDKTASIGALAAANATAADDGPETIELDNLTPDDIVPEAAAAKKKRLRHLKVPNFEKFRLGFFLAGLGVLILIVGWVVAFIVMPKATITIKTNTTSVVSSFDFTASATVSEVDAQQRLVPATLKEAKKSGSEKVKASGEKDAGTKASGEVTLYIACSQVSGTPPTIPAGTAVSTGGLNFITQDDATLNSPSFSPCRFSKTVDVLAAQNGDNYNIGSDKTFTVSGFSTVSGTNDEGFGGGTSKIVKVVSQKDVDDAAGRINAKLEQESTQELTAAFESGQLLMLSESVKAGDPKVTPTPAVNQEAEEVSITSEITYTALGIYRDDLKKVIEYDVANDLDLTKQAISDDGIDNAVMRLNNQAAPDQAFLNFRTSVTAGPQIDEQAVRESARGKKRGEIEAEVGELPGVEEVIVEYDPFWVYSTPKAAKKITVVVQDANGEQVETAADGQ